MKTILIIIIAVMFNPGATFAQGSLEVADNNLAKNQQQIMNEFNGKSNVDLKFYPNPAINYLVIEPQLHSEAGQLKIMDITGKLKTELHLESGTNGITIDLTSYLSGLYILAYYDENNRLLYVNRFHKD